ncbi:MAG: DUF1553 domain-containing protein [Acidobacteria bacterium]|nr:DUF1553 domain-containing protein [Acidobacteriota bacterium]
MSISRVWKWVLVTGVAACSLVPLRRVAAQEPPQEPDDQELLVPHADCIFLGPQRDRFLKGGLLEAQRRAALGEMTSEVAAALPLTLPSRSRSGAIQRRTLPNPGSIDEILFGTMQANGITPADRSTDQEFLRRVTLDLTGRIPTAQETMQFLADPTPNKRSVLVDRLLATPQLVDKWTMFFGDLYKNASRTTQVIRYPEGRDAFYRYLKSSLAANKPYDQMARELISATGGNSFEQGELNFLVGGFTTGGPVQDTWDTETAHISEIFLGIAHMNCLLCHDGRRHLDSLSLWGAQSKRTQAWGMAAFVSHSNLVRQRLGQQGPNYYWSVVENGLRDYPLNTTTGNRPARQPAPGQPATVSPAYMFNGDKPKPGENYRGALAREVTGDFQFARAAVNYIWKQFFGFGIVEPPNQFDLARLDPNNSPPAPWTLQPSNPQLLQKLAQDFIDSKYDLKALMKEITTSQAYQLSARYNGTWNPAWDRFYARKLVRRLEAEEIHDALVQSSGVAASYNIGELGTVQWAMQFPEPVGMPPLRQVAGFLDSFLRGNRDEEERSGETSVLQALNLMNDPFVVSRTQVTQTSLLGKNINLPDNQLVEALYINVLSRYPTDAERAAAMSYLQSGGNRNQKASGLLWSLYNKVDFIFNY